MKKICIILILITIMVSCSERMTKQFIVQSVNSITRNGWTISAPDLIAFKNKSIDEISNNPVPYWLTIRTFAIDNNHKSNLTIDSIGLEFLGMDSTVWKIPSRVALYKKNHIAFDFFKDQGVMIPESVSKVRLFFDAVITDSVTNSSTSHNVSFNMVRNETAAMTPFMVQ